MLRRAFLSFLPAGLLPAVLALAFLIGTPSVGAGTSETSAATWSTDSSRVIRGQLTQEILDVALTQRADEDDTPDDRIIRPFTRILWDPAALKGRFLCAPQTVGLSHRACAARSRAPPTA